MPLRGGSKASHRISVRGLQVLAGLKYLNEQKNKVCVCVCGVCVCVRARARMRTSLTVKERKLDQNAL